MAARPSPVLPILLLSFSLRLSSVCVTHPYFSVYAPQTGPDNSISVFNAIMPQLRSLVNHSPPVPVPPVPYLAYMTHTNESCAHIVRSSPHSAPLHVYRESWIVDLMLNLWPVGIRRNCWVCVCMCMCVCTRLGVTDGEHGLWGMDNVQRNARHLSESRILRALTVSSASLDSRKLRKEICREAERAFAQGWAAVDHKELMASIET